MARKAKKKVHKMPPLSLVDKLIYWLIMLFLCPVYLALMFVPFYLQNVIAFADDTVIAAQEHISSVWHLVTWMTFFLITFILWVQAYQGRKPIFGKRNFQYGPPAWPHVYPLFMKNKPYFFVSKREQKAKKHTAIALVIILLLSFIPFPWSFYGRDCLRYDGSIVQYNMFNRQTHDFASGEIEQIEISTYTYSTGKHSKTWHWGVRMTFRTETGKEYTFEHRDFRSNYVSDLPNALAAMAKLKQRYRPEIIRYVGVEDLHQVIADNQLTEEETALLYQLFG